MNVCLDVCLDMCLILYVEHRVYHGINAPIILGSRQVRVLYHCATGDNRESKVEGRKVSEDKKSFFHVVNLDCPISSVLLYMSLLRYFFYVRKCCCAGMRHYGPKSHSLLIGKTNSTKTKADSGGIQTHIQKTAALTKCLRLLGHRVMCLLKPDVISTYYYK